MSKSINNLSRKINMLQEQLDYVESKIPAAAEPVTKLTFEPEPEPAVEPVTKLTFEPEPAVEPVTKLTFEPAPEPVTAEAQ